jgi:hypothetical protein
MFNFNVVLISPRGLRWRNPVQTMLRRLAATLFDPGKGLGLDARLAGDGYQKTSPDQRDQAIPHFILALDLARLIPCQEFFLAEQSPY